MDQLQDVVSELLAVTREMAEHPEPGGARFAELLQRRGELIRSLCSGAFDPCDERIAAIVREGAGLLGRARCRRDTLRAEAASLERVASLVGTLKSTLSQAGRSGLDVRA